MFEHLVDRLVHRGLLREEQEKRLIGTRTVWPATDVTYKEEARRHLLATLVHGVHPSQRTAYLASGRGRRSFGSGGGGGDWGGDDWGGGDGGGGGGGDGGGGE
ncbi:hypothetical protein J2S40_000239 [Nocardioides luteus]|uniref:Uncharacterized protein n=2 Tax=Nocardioides luteus TaxID=1844 RepID=A0ABQ5SUR8_9ACTN|nr:GPP34 family phosphoprotein [Nocardioides luteus]MDR7309181.1 hypothetical protein [Nocardioides luteus]GGR49267.1 hypothetical protein GCM10010197_13910 [Nocardioides luteus]GLJ67586.1 hypothetical protein GCM10017579_16220 [Nocardioides luteus]